eukprot:scaffold363_cov331-Pavlova_lutheri.AAC.60
MSTCPSPVAVYPSPKQKREGLFLLERASELPGFPVAGLLVAVLCLSWFLPDAVGVPGLGPDTSAMPARFVGRGLSLRTTSAGHTPPLFGCVAHLFRRTLGWLGSLSTPDPHVGGPDPNHRTTCCFRGQKGHRIRSKGETSKGDVGRNVPGT